jgi:hypothetical protein
MCVHVKIMELCWDLMTDYALELKMYVCVHAKIM